MQYKKILSPILFLLFLSLVVNAQRAEIGIVAGGAGYMGDLNQNNPLKISGISAGAYGKINFTPFVGLGMHYNFGNIKGDDLKSSNPQFVDRAINFNTKMHELSLIADVNFFDILSPVSKRRFTPYVFGGIGGVYFGTTATYSGAEYPVTLMTTNADASAAPIKYKPYTITIPYGAGLKYRLSDYFMLTSQIGYRTSFTDYIDDVGGYYTGFGFPDNPSSNPLIGAIGTQRGDLRKRDTYMFVSIGISYTFVSQKCFTF